MDVLLLVVLASAKLACLPPSRRENEAPGSVFAISDGELSSADCYHHKFVKLVMV